MQVFDWRYGHEAAVRLLLRLGDAGSANRKRQNGSAVLVQISFTCQTRKVDRPKSCMASI